MERRIIKARKHTVNDVKRILEEMDRIANTNYSRLPIKTSARMTRALGGAVCKISERGFETKVKGLEFKFSKFFLDANLTDKDFEDIVVHEWMHIYVNELHQDDCNHDKRFKDACRKFGYANMGGYTCSKEISVAFTDAIKIYKAKKFENEARG